MLVERLQTRDLLEIWRELSRRRINERSRAGEFALRVAILALDIRAAGARFYAAETKASRRTRATGLTLCRRVSKSADGGRPLPTTLQTQSRDHFAGVLACPPGFHRTLPTSSWTSFWRRASVETVDVFSYCSPVAF